MLPEFGGIELMAIAAIALIIIGPKDLPVMLRKLGKFVGKMRGMAQEFRASFDELARQSELDELRKEVEAMRLAQSYDPTGLVPGAYGPQPGFDAVSEHDSATLSESLAAEPPAPEKPAKPAKTPRRANPATPKAKAKPTAKPSIKTTTPARSARKPAKPRARAGTVQ